jgi:hypothetical protein
LRHSIRGAVEQALEGTGASVEIGRVGITLPGRSITVRNVRIRAHGNDTARRGYTVVSFDATFPRLTLRGVGYRRIGERAALKASRVVLDSPSVSLVTEMVSSDGNEKPPRQALPGTSPREGSRLREKIAGFDVGEVSVTGAAFELTRWLADGGHTRMVMGGGGFSARGVTLDSLPVEIRLAVDSVAFHLAGGAQVWRADSLEVDTARRIISLRRGALVPQFDKNEFAERSTRHEDWTAITLGGIVCRGVDFARLAASDGRTLAIDSVALASADIASYKNRKVHRQPRHKSMLHEAIQRLPIPTDIGTLTFADLDIAYEELSERGDIPGEVTLTRGRGTVTNLTNIAAGHDRFMTVDLAATFMRSGELEARFLFPVDVADDHWELSGRLGPTDMTAFNRALEPLINAKITSGQIRSLSFDMSGTLATSHAHVAMAYNDLGVAFLDPHDHTHIRHFLTVIADKVLIRPDNPVRDGRDGRGRLREADAEHTRDPERSMWNFIWHSLLPAILKTVI